MLRKPFLFSVVAACLATGTSRADILPLFNDVPPSYTPGTPFTFQIVLPDGLNGVSSYVVGLVIDVSVNNPPITMTASPPSTGYVFPTTSGFSSNSFTGPGPNEVSVTFSDSISGVVSTAPGQDVLADITVNPGSALTGPITVSFNSNTLVTYYTEGFDFTPGPIEIPQGQPTPPTVPTPAGWISLTIGVLMLAGRQRLRRVV
jgi:hypothetical protein